MSIGEIIAACGFAATAVGNAFITWWRTAENAIAIINVANDVEGHDKRIVDLEKSKATSDQWRIDMERRMSDAERKRT